MQTFQMHVYEKESQSQTYFAYYFDTHFMNIFVSWSVITKPWNKWDLGVRIVYKWIKIVIKIVIQRRKL